jgi:hypothetical protein
LFAGLELGARIRPTTELVGARVGTQLLSALGVGYDILPRQLLSVTAEAWVLPTLVEQHDIQTSQPGVFNSVPNGKYTAPAEWHVSVRSAPLHGGDVSFQAGGGGAIPFGGDTPVATPRFRFTLGIRWAPSSPAGGGTGGATPSPPVAAEASPSARGAVVDLHLAGKDVCKDAPDLVDGFRDDDGCPDEDQDKDGIPDRLDKCPLAPEDFVGLSDGCPESSEKK